MIPNRSIHRLGRYPKELNADGQAVVAREGFTSGGPPSTSLVQGDGYYPVLAPPSHFFFFLPVFGLENVSVSVSWADCLFSVFSLCLFDVFVRSSFAREFWCFVFLLFLEIFSRRQDRKSQGCTGYPPIILQPATRVGVALTYLREELYDHIQQAKRPDDFRDSDPGGTFRKEAGFRKRREGELECTYTNTSN